jgi:cell division protein FtsN
MRDLRKLRTKYEIKLDNRHIAYLLAGELLIVVIVFSLGVVVGKGMGQLDQLEKSTTVAAANVTPSPEAGTPPPVTLDSLLQPEISPPPVELSPTPAEPLMQTPLPTAADLAPALPAVPGQAAKVDIGSLPAPPKGGDYWTVQVGSYPTKEEAMAIYQRLMQTGSQPMVEEADLGDRGMWYRVSVGQFATEAGARAMALALRERENTDTWVRYVP